MKELKFLGKRIDGEGWAIGDLVTEVHPSDRTIMRAFIHNRLSHVSGPSYPLGSIIVVNEVDPETIGQFTNMHDKNGTEIYFNQQLKIKRTLHDGQYTSEAIYRVTQGNFGGIELRFASLFENGDEGNQYPVDTTLCERYGSLDVDFKNQKYDRLAVPDTWGENHLLRDRWKSSDYSNDIEIWEPET